MKTKINEKDIKVGMTVFNTGWGRSSTPLKVYNIDGELSFIWNGESSPIRGSDNPNTWCRIDENYDLECPNCNNNRHIIKHNIVVGHPPCVQIECDTCGISVPAKYSVKVIEQ